MTVDSGRERGVVASGFPASGCQAGLWLDLKFLRIGRGSGGWCMQGRLRVRIGVSTARSVLHQMFALGIVFHYGVVFPNTSEALANK
jgi:hypothetical protein